MRSALLLNLALLIVLPCAIGWNVGHWSAGVGAFAALLAGSVVAWLVYPWQSDPLDLKGWW